MARAHLNQCISKYHQGAMGHRRSHFETDADEMQCDIAHECLQLFGDYGYTLEYPISIL